MHKPKLYSYQRFSTKDQAGGDSLRRQTEMARRYAEENGYDLDTSLELQDLGVSGFKGANRAKGRLGDFLRMVKAGQIAGGSALFIEALDRYSRSNPIEALLELFQRLISYGIIVITGADGQIYDKKSFDGFNGSINGMRMLLALGVANQESAQKSARLRAACKSKRKAVHENSAIYRKQGPFWVTFDASQNAFILNENADLVRKIFKMYISGLGGTQIANSLNRKAIKSARGKCWQPASVMRLIKDRKVIGEFQLSRTSDGRHTKLIPDGPSCKNYYPRCVSDSVFLEANKILKNRPKGCGKTSTEFIDIFDRIIFCGNTGISLNKERYGYDRSRYFVRYKNGLKDGFSGWKISTVEKCFFYLSSSFDFDSIAKYESKKINSDKISSIKVEIDRLEIECNNWKNAISIGGDIEDFVIEYQKAKEKQDELKHEYEQLNGEYKESKNTIINKKGSHYYYNLFYKRNESKENRLILRRIIKEEVEKVLLFPDGIKTDLFLNEDQKHLVGIKYPVVGIISRNVNFSCFLAFECKRGEPEPICINGSISNRNTTDLLKKSDNRIIA